MCTAITYQGKDFYLGRNLDYEFGYGQKVLVTPRNFPMHFRHMEDLNEHYAMIGIGVLMGDLPQYFDGMNEKGLAIAGLNFVGNAYFSDVQEGKDNLAQFEFIPYLLAKFGSVEEVKGFLKNMNMDHEAVLENYAPAQLHWIIGDEKQTITVEIMQDGIHVYDNPVGVLTNNPPFDYQMFHLNDYRGLSNAQPENRFAKNLPLQLYSRGMGAMGLPGDLSSASRFVKVAFTRNNCVSYSQEEQCVSQFFHILTSVEQQSGCCEVKENEYEYTLYSSCMNTKQGIYYWKTYFNHQIQAVSLHHCDLQSTQIQTFEIHDQEQIHYHN